MKNPRARLRKHRRSQNDYGRRVPRVLAVISTIFLFFLSSNSNIEEILLRKDDPPSVEDIENYIKKLAELCPSPILYKSYGSSQQGKSLPLIEIGKGNASRTILLTAGLHGREQQAPLSVLLAAKAVCASPIDDYKLLIVPLMNPDGYEFARTVARPARKTWPKDTRLPCREPNTEGVDLNRNFPVGWSPSPQNPCDVTYPGPKPLSEVESKAISNLVLAHKKNIVAHIDVHSFGQILFVARACGRINRTLLQRQTKIAFAVRFAIQESTQNQYSVWPAYIDPLSKIQRCIGGTLMDYVTEHGIPSIVLELGPKWSFDNRANGFFESKNMATLRAQEVFEAITATVSATRFLKQ